MMKQLFLLSLLATASFIYAADSDEITKKKTGREVSEFAKKMGVSRQATFAAVLTGNKDAEVVMHKTEEDSWELVENEQEQDEKAHKLALEFSNKKRG